MDELIAKLGELVKGEIKVAEPMAKHTTFEIGGPAQVFVEATCVQDIQNTVITCAESGVDLHVLGAGSNLLVNDAGIDGIVLHLGECFANIVVQNNYINVQAGATNEAVAKVACEAGLSGYEFASGIPGTVGGAAIMNAGAYDGEFKDVAIEVACVNGDGKVIMLNAEMADWGYRHSRMMEEGLIVVSARLKLAPKDPAEIQAAMDDLRKRREDKQPLELPSAGSTFKRPEGYFAGKLIQDADMQGHTVGGAQVSLKHAGFVVNFDGATASDVLGVIRDVQDAVFKMEGVRLEPEVRMWGF